MCVGWVPLSWKLHNVPKYYLQFVPVVDALLHKLRSVFFFLLFSLFFCLLSSLSNKSLLAATMLLCGGPQGSVVGPVRFKLSRLLQQIIFTSVHLIFICDRSEWKGEFAKGAAVGLYVKMNPEPWRATSSTSKLLQVGTRWKDEKVSSLLVSREISGVCWTFYRRTSICPVFRWIKLLQLDAVAQMKV